MLVFCHIEGCNSPIVAKGLCSTHYKRLKRHGNPLSGRPPNWGKAEKHPLWHSHQWAKKYNTLCNEWLDFWVFAEYLKDRPEGCTLRRINSQELLSPTNFYWKKTIKHTSHAEYMKKWNKVNPEKARNIYYKKRFGITLEQYNDILKRQGGVCAICNEKDLHYGNLAVDHNHSTNKVRGLLCHLCNRALGMFKDDSYRLEKALNYLKLS